jgi:hypothetical protein
LRKPMILNRKNTPASIAKASVNCMRPGPWGNPFISGVDGVRETVCWKFEQWLATGETFGCVRATGAKRQWILANIGELRGRDLLCCCRPKQCHCETLERLSNVSGPTVSG